MILYYNRKGIYDGYEDKYIIPSYEIIGDNLYCAGCDRQLDVYLLIPSFTHIYLYIYVLSLVRVTFSDDGDSSVYYRCFGKSNIYRLIYVEYPISMIIRD